METMGMTQGDQQGEISFDPDMEGGNVEEAENREESESMEDDQDPEVSLHISVIFYHIITAFTVWNVICLSCGSSSLGQ